jgi:hypothetical protein
MRSRSGPSAFSEPAQRRHLPAEIGSGMSGIISRKAALDSHRRPLPGSMIWTHGPHTFQTTMKCSSPPPERVTTIAGRQFACGSSRLSRETSTR